MSTRPHFITPPKKEAQKQIKIKMLKTARGANDQIKINVYHEGNEYEVNEHLANNFVKDGNAEFSGLFSGKQKAKLEQHDNKAMKDHYQNKSA